MVEVYVKDPGYAQRSVRDFFRARELVFFDSGSINGYSHAGLVAVTNGVVESAPYSFGWEVYDYRLECGAVRFVYIGRSSSNSRIVRPDPLSSFRIFATEIVSGTKDVLNFLRDSNLGADRVIQVYDLVRTQRKIVA